MVREKDAEEKTWALIFPYLEQATPEQWHLYAAKSDFDYNALGLQWLIDNPQLDEATARMLFWNMGAGFLAQYASLEEVPQGEKDDYQTVRILEERILNGFYQPPRIWYDPHDNDMVNMHDYADIPAKRAIPAELSQKVGEVLVQLKDPSGYEDGLPEALCRQIMVLFNE